MKSKEEIQQEAERLAQRGYAYKITGQPNLLEEFIDLLTARDERDELKKRDALELIADQNKKLRTELERVKGDRDNAVKAYEDVKAWGHRLESNLETLLAECDENACGSEDSAPVEKFANRLIGLCNEIQLGNVRTLRSQLAALMVIARAAKTSREMHQENRSFVLLDKAIKDAEENGIQIEP